MSSCEERADKVGLPLPVTIAPYHVHLCLLGGVGSPGEG